MNKKQKREQRKNEKIQYLVSMLDLMTKTRKKIVVEDVNELKRHQAIIKKKESKMRKNERRKQREKQRHFMHIEKKKKKLRKKARQERKRQLEDI